MAYGAQPHLAYQQNSVTTATPEELTLKLYSGCIRFIKLAKKAMEENNIQDKNTNIQKAQDIIRELMVTLNMDYDISHQLMPLYEYMNHQLLQANIKNDPALLEEVQGMAEDFRETWQQVMKANKLQKQAR
ncbi:flagellar export chaperone FliS [Piscibacillus halophilus]|uniref:Flagellar secretion chaperone FliS n=2 Tax=Piscibacillus halophilus TaxID=571933 RepID=A0A1H9EIG9_9BACI|nr:flagellar export chaperone FliS [Piscibacillus halophilus]SEQ25033.1 flagellar protein FliS [Piscibacillus halophilus]